MTDTNRISLSEFITPTRLIIQTTLPMGMFQFIGHITSHKATSLIPVSIVHTIKSLSPIITVLIYRFLFGKSYRMRTYVTLIPLCCGIMLTCYKKAILVIKTMCRVLVAVLLIIILTRSTLTIIILLA